MTHAMPMIAMPTFRPAKSLTLVVDGGYQCISATASRSVYAQGREEQSDDVESAVDSGPSADDVGRHYGEEHQLRLHRRDSCVDSRAGAPSAVVSVAN